MDEAFRDASDFGIQGEPPTHPELLDWLAVEFMEKGWSFKAMHRLLVTSAPIVRPAHPTSRVNPSIRKTCCSGGHAGGGWKESLRDAMLAVANRLDSRMSGPSVHPPLPVETPGAKSCPVDSDPRARDRRSVYVYVKRNLRYPLFHLFDVPDSNETCARRHVSVNAPQALALLNSQLTRDLARSLAQRVWQESGRNATAAVELAVLLALGRAPDEREKQTLTEFVKQTSASSNTDAALEDVCHALLNLNEFLYVD